MNEEFFRILLSTFLQREFRSVKVTAQRSFSGIDTDMHGIRVDAYIEELPGEDAANAVIYEIEAENRRADKPLLPRRSRFYSGIIDTQHLAAGAEYPDMKELVMLTILSYDPFDRREMWYEAKTMLKSHPDYPYDDGVRRIFLYADGKINQEVLSKAGISDGGRIRDMLKYICESKRENVKNDDIHIVDDLVSRVKRRKDIGIRYMQSWEYMAAMKREAREAGLAEGREAGLAEGREAGLAEGRAEGRAEGLIRLVMRKHEKGKDIEQIADELEEEHAKIEAIVAVIRSCGAEATPEMVYEKAIATR